MSVTGQIYYVRYEIPYQLGIKPTISIVILSSLIYIRYHIYKPVFRVIIPFNIIATRCRIRRVFMFGWELKIRLNCTSVSEQTEKCCITLLGCK